MNWGRTAQLSGWVGLQCRKASGSSLGGGAVGLQSPPAAAQPPSPPAPHSHLDIGTLPFGELLFENMQAPEGRGGIDTSIYPQVQLAGRPFPSAFQWSCLKICKHRKERVPSADPVGWRRPFLPGFEPERQGLPFPPWRSGIWTLRFNLQGALIATWI